jgi:hypothetical protein
VAFCPPGLFPLAVYTHPLYCNFSALIFKCAIFKWWFAPRCHAQVLYLLLPVFLSVVRCFRVGASSVFFNCGGLAVLFGPFVYLCWISLRVSAILAARFLHLIILWRLVALFFKFASISLLVRAFCPARELLFATCFSILLFFPGPFNFV